jgi:hypothetical protein
MRSSSARKHASRTDTQARAFTHMDSTKHISDTNLPAGYSVWRQSYTHATTVLPTRIQVSKFGLVAPNLKCYIRIRSSQLYVKKSRNSCFLNTDNTKPYTLSGQKQVKLS